MHGACSRTFIYNSKKEATMAKNTRTFPRKSNHRPEKGRPYICLPDGTVEMGKPHLSDLQNRRQIFDPALAGAR